MPEPSTWLLTARERGNPATRLDDRHAGGEAWSTGNEVSPLVHGAAYFADLAAEVRKLRAGDLQLVTDRRGEPTSGWPVTAAPSPGLCAAPHGAAYLVRALVWRSHLDHFQFSERGKPAPG